MSEAFRMVAVTRVRDACAANDMDVAAAEEPLEVRLQGEPFAVVMRTPGDDRELAAGFLHGEGIIRSAADVRAILSCRNADGEVLPNVLDVTLRDEHQHALATERRHLIMSASCGMCGRLTIDALRADAAPIKGDWTIDAGIVESLPDTLRPAQAGFDETGGLHAAGLFRRDGALVTIAEDIGRHNAVDKVVGRLLLSGAAGNDVAERLSLSDLLLFVSGRSSFEIVQKALLAGIPLVAAVSAPSSLAIELARESGITLLGFVRGRTFNIYTRADRVVCSAKV